MHKLLRALALIIAAMLVVLMTGCDNIIIQSTTPFVFKEECVAVVVPPQGKEVKVKKLDPFFKELPKQNGFSPGREVINFEVVDAATEEIITAFDPPIELYVVYNEKDLANAGNQKENLGLAFWDDDDKRWILFTEKKHEFKLQEKDSWAFDEFFKLPDDTLGFGFVKVHNWKDRPIAWGELE